MKKRWMALVAMLVPCALAQVRHYPVPEIIGPPKWQEGGTHTEPVAPVWHQPAPYWQDAKYIKVTGVPYYVDPQFETVAVPAVIEYVPYPAKMGYREPVTKSHPAETKEHPAEYETITPPGTWSWVEDLRDELVFLDGYDEEGMYWFWFGWMEVDYGYDVYTPGIPYEKETKKAWTETIKDPWTEVLDPGGEYEIYPAGSYPVVVAPDTTKTVMVKAGGWVTPEDTWEQVTAAGMVYPPGNYVAQPDKVVQEEGEWISGNTPASTLTVHQDGKGIGFVHWIHPVKVPTWIDPFLHDNHWVATDDDSDDSVWNEGLAFAYARGAQTLPRLVKGTARLQRDSEGRWVIMDGTQAVSREEAEALIDIFLTDAAILIRKAENKEDVYCFLNYEAYKIPPAPPAPLEIQKVYSGRTWGRGTPQQVLATRASSHKAKRPDLIQPLAINAAMVTREYEYAAYAAHRWREQSLIDHHDLHEQLPHLGYEWQRSHSENARPGTYDHGMRGVARANIRAREYFAYSEKEYGHLWEYTGHPARVAPFFLEDAETLIEKFVRPPLFTQSNLVPPTI